MCSAVLCCRFACVCICTEHAPLVVVGAGAAGLTAAYFAAKQGAQVGGDGGCGGVLCFLLLATRAHTGQLMLCLFAPKSTVHVLMPSPF